jgi:hypothetical protein
VTSPFESNSQHRRRAVCLGEAFGDHRFDREIGDAGGSLSSPLEEQRLLP